MNRPQQAVGHSAHMKSLLQKSRKIARADKPAQRSPKLNCSCQW
jgi:hypothetical protein